MRERLQQTAEGRTHVQCPFTLTKRLGYIPIHFFNKFPIISAMMMILFLASIVLGGASFVAYLIKPEWFSFVPELLSKVIGK